MSTLKVTELRCRITRDMYRNLTIDIDFKVNCSGLTNWSAQHKNGNNKIHTKRFWTSQIRRQLYMSVTY